MHFVYYEGAFLSEEEAKIPVTDRGLLFGDGAYATVQVNQGVPRFLPIHLERLDVQCRSFGLLMPSLSPSIIDELIRLNHAHEGIWRLKVIVTGGDDPAFYLPQRTGRLLMTLKPYTPPPVVPLRIGIFPHPFHLCHASYKSLAHLNRLYVMEEARQQGMDDCLTLTETGNVLETAFGNLCWLVEDTLFTPSRQLPLYFGVTLSQLIIEAQEKGYRVEEVTVSLDALPSNGLYFRTNSMGGIRPIGEIGGQQYTVYTTSSLPELMDSTSASRSSKLRSVSSPRG